MEKTAQPLTELVANQLIDYIKINKLEPGDKVPNEYILAEELQVSRSTFREAVKQLVARNILEVRQGSGTYVSEKKGIADDPLGFSFIRDTYQLTKDLFEIRLLLEPRIVARAAQRATKEDCRELERLVEAIEASYDQETADHVYLDVEFHAYLAKMSGNLALDSLLPIINQSITLINDNIKSKELQKASRSAHRKILSAIESGDGVAAHDAMLNHILTVSADMERESSV